MIMDITPDERQMAKNGLFLLSRRSLPSTSPQEREIEAYVMGFRHGVLSREGEVSMLLFAAEHGISQMLTKKEGDTSYRLLHRCPQCVQAVEALQKHGFLPHVTLDDQKGL